VHKKDPVKGGPPRPPAGATDSTIRVVAARTGLAMETLRSWERRYGFPTPGRRPGSNRRLYSAADVERLLSIRRALDRGYRVGDVIDKTMPELEALAAGPPTVEPAPEAPSVPGGAAAALVALLARDRVVELEGELRRAALALGPRRFVTELAHPFAAEVGAAWAEGRLFVRHEHLATECLVTQMRQMLAGYQDVEARPLVLLATLPGEPHTLPLQMVALYLVTLGAKPRLLGGPTPPDEIAGGAKVLGADVVGLSVTLGSDREGAREGVKALRRGLPAGVPVWLGGAGAAALGVDCESTRVVGSWASIDEALALWRGRPGGRAS
jgi:DNA-binding transcriptional MerR regulator/methylmalonyl-CoA mutase cobalamin-binding subunit